MSRGLRGFINWTFLGAVIGLLVGAILSHWLGFKYGLGIRWPKGQQTEIYSWWSGSGSVILPPIITVAGIGGLAYWHHMCHVRGCWRYGRGTHSDELGHTVPICHRCRRLRLNGTQGQDEVSWAQ